MMRWAWAGLAIAVMVTAPASAQLSGSDIVHKGAGRVPACASCHGADGAGQAGAGIPRIGGMNEAYLEHELLSMARGTRRSAVMSPIAKALAPQQVKAVAAYYAEQSSPSTSGTASREAIAHGRVLAQDGDWPKGIPACGLCHGAEGSGIGGQFPRLAGQHADYIESQLQAWRDGARHNDPMGLMGNIARKLSHQQSAEVAAYFAAAPKLPSLPSLPATKLKLATKVPGGHFAPPPNSAIPRGPFGAMVRLGQNIFTHTGQYAPQFTGNALNCSNCHIDAGKRANSAPLWAAYVAYPAYRSKNKHVNSFQERLQGCFRFSMNGKAPPLGNKVLLALETYSYFLATGAPTHANMTGRGYPELAKPPLAMSYARGQGVYQSHCALCHGAQGQGQFTASGKQGFPPLWGDRSFNWGAGMADIKQAAGFIKANMPLSQGGTLSDQQAWDVAMFIDSQQRPQDPRFVGSVSQTRAKYHDSPTSMYGREVNGIVLGSPSSSGQR